MKPIDQTTTDQLFHSKPAPINLPADNSTTAQRRNHFPPGKVVTPSAKDKVYAQAVQNIKKTEEFEDA
jgi:hypothetical protein